MTRTGDREIHSVSGRLPDNPGELAYMEQTSFCAELICRNSFQTEKRLLQNRNTQKPENNKLRAIHFSDGRSKVIYYRFSDLTCRIHYCRPFIFLAERNKRGKHWHWHWHWPKEVKNVLTKISWQFEREFYSLWINPSLPFTFFRKAN